MKFRSYNEELLIAQALIGNVFNDIVIDRRNHGINRDYSTPLTMDQIMQKEIEIPCIFGDRSIILKSLENQNGVIKLPLYILTSKGIQVDTKRQADLHVDVFYQQDQAFSRLPPSHPLYRPYNLKKRRGLPVTISYGLTMITKYKEDLDQMCTNWMVHWRPDIYVKWWHPRNKSEPLQSEITWNQSITIESNQQFEVNRKFKWQASAEFTFKTWLFPGLNYEEDSFRADEEEYNRTHEALIEHINVYATTPQFDGVPMDQEGFPVLGDLFEQTNPQNSTQIGMYAVPTNMDMDTAEEMVNNNNTANPAIDQTPNTTLTNTAGNVQRDPVQKPQTADASIVYNKYANYVLMPPINNDIIQMKYVYFFGGAPLSDMPAKGDILFNNFSKDLKNGKERDFGDAYSDPMNVIFDYDIQNKVMSIYGQKCTEYYKSVISSQITDQAIKQQVLLQSNKEDIKLDINRALVYDQQKQEFVHNIKDSNYNFTKTSNIAIWNDILCKRQHMHNMDSTDWQLFENMSAKKNYTYDIRFKIQTPIQISRINGLTKLLNTQVNNLELKELSKQKYKLTYDSVNFWKVLNHINIDKKEFCNLDLRKSIKVSDNCKYFILANNNIWIVIKSTANEEDEIEDELYDYGISTLPVFQTVPIFNITLQDHQLVHSIGTQYYIGGK